MAEKKKRLVLLDAHAIIHRAYHALPDFASSKGEPTGALYGLSTMILKIAGELKPDWIVATYDLPKPTHRHEAYKEYKAGRAKADEELVSQIKYSRRLLEALSIPIYDKEGFEADDILGTIVEKMRTAKAGYRPDVIIASGDMDTLQLVDGEASRVYTLKKGIQDTVLYDESAVIKRFGFPPALLPDYKGLAGDPSDNIVGVKGIGEKTATILIQKFGSIEKIYEALDKKDSEKVFVDSGIKPRIIQLLKDNREEAEFSKLLATIRKDAPIDFVLPKKRWAESVDVKKAEEVFSLLEFRTMSERLKKALADNSSAPATDSGRASLKERQMAEKNSGKLAEKGGTPGLFGGEEDSLAVKEAGLMLWLLNSSMTDPKWDDVRTYTKKDAPDEAKAYLLNELKRQGLIEIFEKIEKPLIPVVEKMNARGVAVDTDYLSKLGKEYSAQVVELEKKIWQLAGEKFNINSPKQMGEVLFTKLGLKAKNQKKTGTGALSTKESELAKLVEAHPIVPLILQYRELAKLLSTYIDNLIPMVGPDGRLRARFLQAGTTTGRMSSDSPNLQNIPNHTELGVKIRRAFVAERGKTLLSFDYSQMELRIGAFLSGDERMIDIFKRGEDVHSAVASAVFGVPMDKVDKEMRRRAKVINFGVMYGMGLNALKAQLGTSREEAQKFYEEYFRKFSGLARYLEEVKKETAQRGYTETVFGRRRYFEGINSRLPFIRAAAERMAINAPIQGTGADIIKLSMIEADQWIEKERLSEKVRLILQVHDELVYEVDKESSEKAGAEIKRIMESRLGSEKTKGVPIVVGVSAGPNWGEMKSV